MGIEGGLGNPPRELSEERNKLIKKVFEKWHKKLVSWCKYRLDSKSASHNPKSDAEEIVAYVYQQLLSTPSTLPDLTLDNRYTINYLNKVLDYAVANYLNSENAQKRKPAGGFVSVEEMLEGNEEEELESRLRQYFHYNPDKEVADEEEAKHRKIEESLARLEKLHPKWANIIRKRYLEDKTLQEVADEYGDSRENIRTRQIKALYYLKRMAFDILKGDSKIPRYIPYKKQKKEI
jgi:RNA polymerase sigma factor (sigma-70 family)